MFERIEPTKFFSIITNNMQGAKQVKTVTGIQDFCSSLLKLRADYNATVICIQDVHIKQDSAIINRINKTLAPEGYSLALNTFTHTDARDKIKVRARGTAILYPISALVEDSHRPKQQRATSSITYGYKTSVTLDDGNGHRMHIISVLSPPDQSQAKIRIHSFPERGEAVGWCYSASR